MFVRLRILIRIYINSKVLRENNKMKVPMWRGCAGLNTLMTKLLSTFLHINFPNGHENRSFQPNCEEFPLYRFFRVKIIGARNPSLLNTLGALTPSTWLKDDLEPTEFPFTGVIDVGLAIFDRIPFVANKWGILFVSSFNTTVAVFLWSYEWGEKKANTLFRIIVL